MQEIEGFGDIRPEDYLSRGFVTPEGELQEGLNGYYSLAMAYRCRDEDVSPDAIHALLEEIGGLADRQPEASPDDELDAGIRKDLERIGASDAVRASSALGELFASALPRIRRWRDLAAFSVHLERIMGQLALLLYSRQAPEESP